MLTIPLFALFGAFLADRYQDPRWKRHVGYVKRGIYPIPGAYLHELQVDPQHYEALQQSERLRAKMEESHKQLEQLLLVIDKTHVPVIEALLDKSLRRFEIVDQLQASLRHEIIQHAGHPRVRGVPADPFAQGQVKLPVRRRRG